MLEADEYDRSFLHLNPTISILNSVDADHLDIYNEHSKMINVYLEYLGKTVENGIILLHEEVAQVFGEKIILKLKNKYQVLIFWF